MLKGQDIVIALLMRLSKQNWTYEAIGSIIGLSTSQCHLACKRLQAARLLSMDPNAPWLISGLGLVEFLSHAVPYVFPAKIGEVTRGIPTAYAAAFVREAFSTTQSSQVLVWPIVGGPAKGNRMDPLHSCQLPCVKKPEFDPVYRALVCIDLIRIGQARERAWAVKKVADLINDA